MGTSNGGNLTFYPQFEMYIRTFGALDKAGVQALSQTIRDASVKNPWYKRYEVPMAKKRPVSVGIHYRKFDRGDYIFTVEVITRATPSQFYALQMNQKRLIELVLAADSNIEQVRSKLHLADTEIEEVSRIATA